jgi:hypothetical protein
MSRSPEWKRYVIQGRLARFSKVRTEYRSSSLQPDAPKCAKGVSFCGKNVWLAAKYLHGVSRTCKMGLCCAIVAVSGVKWCEHDSCDVDRSQEVLATNRSIAYQQFLHSIDSQRLESLAKSPKSVVLHIVRMVDLGPDHAGLAQLHVPVVAVSESQVIETQWMSCNFRVEAAQTRDGHAASSPNADSQMRRVAQQTTIPCRCMSSRGSKSSVARLSH